MTLWSACEHADLAAVRACLDEGASVAERNRLGWNALHRAVMSGSTACVALVLPEEAAARVELLARPDMDGNAPLHMAAGCGHAAVVTQLIGAGAAPDVPKRTGDERKEEGATPMHTLCKALAAAAEEPERQERLFATVLALLNGGGLLESQDDRGRMAAAFLPPATQKQLLERVRAAAARGPPG